MGEGNASCAPARPGQFSHLSAGGNVIALLAMLVNIEAARLDFFRGAQANYGLDDEGDNGGADASEDQSEADGFKLFPNQGLESRILHERLHPIILQTRVDGSPRQHPGHEGPQRAADRMDAESIQCVVIAEPTLYF